MCRLTIITPGGVEASRMGKGTGERACVAASSRWGSRIYCWHVGSGTHVPTARQPPDDAKSSRSKHVQTPLTLYQKNSVESS